MFAILANMFMAYCLFSASIISSSMSFVGIKSPIPFVTTRGLRDEDSKWIRENDKIFAVVDEIACLDT